MPSSDRKGICRFSAFEGRGGTTIYKKMIDDKEFKKTIMKWSIKHLTLLSLSSSFLSHSKSEYLLRTDDSLTRNTGKLVFIRTS